MDPLASGVPWFPQEYAVTFYWIKGLLALVAVALLLIHMRSARQEAGLTPGRWLRYLSLLFFAVLLAGASVEQVNDAALVSYRNLGGLIGSLVLIVATSVSIAESRSKP